MTKRSSFKNRSTRTSELSAWLQTAALLVLVAEQVNCGSSTCSSSIVTPPTIKVIDSESGRAVCNANILVTQMTADGTGSGSAVQGTVRTLTDAGLPDVEAPRVLTSTCTYSWDQSSGAGVYTIQVTRSGYEPATVSNVYMAEGGCDSDPTAEQVVVRLQPSAR